MNITPAQLRAIQQKASTLIERHGSTLISGEILHVLPMHQLWIWDQQLSNTSTGQLRQRLSLFHHVQPQIAEAQAKYKNELENQNGWIAEFRTILKYYHTDILQSSPITFSGSRSVAFESLLIPFIWHAYQSLAVHTKDSRELITPDVLHTHCRALLTELSRLSAPCFFSAFDEFRKRLRLSEGPDTGDTQYRRFETSMYSEGIIGFFEEYSALARLLVIKTQHWIRGTVLLIERLQNDLPALAETFFNGVSPTRVKQLRCGFSAPHSADGMVFELMFTNRRKLIYKPRSGDTDIALYKILSWFNSCIDLEPMQAVRVLSRENYSWHEYIAPRTCRNEAEAERYYTRIGQLAALLHILGSTDYHFENLRARGAHPYLIDNETLLSPYVKIGEGHTFSGDAILDTGIIHSLARSLFLLDTRRLFYPDSTSIAGVFESRDRDQIVQYFNVNTDAMYDSRRFRTRQGQNIPAVGNRKVNPGRYVFAIKEGYHHALQYISENKTHFYELVKNATSEFDLDVRMLVRPTKVYMHVLSDSLHPDHLREGVKRSIFFEQMARFYRSSDAPNECEKLLFEEVAGLQDHLVPWFHIPMRQAAWHQTDENRSVIRMSAQQVVEENLNRLNSGFIEKHMHMFRDYLERTPAHSKIIHYTTKDTFHCKSASELFGKMCAVANHLHYCYKHVYPWNDFDTKLRTGRKSIFRHYAFDDGLLGVLVTLAHYESYLQENCRETICNLLKPLEQYYANNTLSTESDGGHTGYSKDRTSVIYGLFRLGHTLRDDNLILHAIEFAKDEQSGRTPHVGHWQRSELAHYAFVLANLYESIKDQNLRILLQNAVDALFSDDSAISSGTSIPFEVQLRILQAGCAAYHVLSDPVLKTRIKTLYQNMRDPLQREQQDFLQARHKLDKTRNPEITSFTKGLAGRLTVQIRADRIFNEHNPDHMLLNAAQKLLSIHPDDTDNISTGIAGRCEPALLLYDHLGGALNELIDTWHHRWVARQAFNLAPHYLNPFFIEGISGVLYQQIRLLQARDMPPLQFL